MGLWTDVVGTVRGYIRLGLTGVRLKNSSGALAVRNAGDSAYANVECGDVYLGPGNKLVFEGTTDDAYETTVDPGDPTADRTLTLPNKSGTLALVPTVLSAVTMATGSPTYIDVTGIPSGVTYIFISFKNYSTNGTSVGIIQLGDSGGPENSGYEGTTQIGTNRLAHSSGFAMSYSASAAYAMRGTIVLTRLDSGGTEWMAVGQLTVDALANGIYQIVGNKTLTGELTQIRWTTTGGTDVADGGTMYISYL